MVAKIILRSAIILFWVCVIGALFSLSFLPLGITQRTLNICAWIGMFDAEYISRFEHETGIKVNVSYFESNDELILKIEGNSGYDLIVPSDYSVHYLASRGLLKKLDKRKMDFYASLNPLLLGHYFDMHNEYSLPYEWAVFGIGINKDCFKGGIPSPSWQLIFKPTLENNNKLIMTNDPMVALPLASLYLFGETIPTKQRIPALKTLLRRQHQFVEVYGDLRAHYYLASRNGCIGVVSSSIILKAMRSHKHIDFIIPHEGSLLTIESFAIPRTSKHEDEANAFMNFMMKKESLIHSFATLGLFPSRLDVLENLPLNAFERSIIRMPKEKFAQLHLVRYDAIQKVLSPQQLQDFWVQIKT